MFGFGFGRDFLGELESEVENTLQEMEERRKRRLYTGMRTRKSSRATLARMTPGILRDKGMVLYQITLADDRLAQFQKILENERVSDEQVKETAEYLHLVNEGLKVFLIEKGIYEEDE